MLNDRDVGRTVDYSESNRNFLHVYASDVTVPIGLESETLRAIVAGIDYFLRVYTIHVHLQFIHSNKSLRTVFTGENDFFCMYSINVSFQAILSSKFFRATFTGEDNFSCVNTIYVYLQTDLSGETLPTLVIIACEYHFFPVHVIDVRVKGGLITKNHRAIVAGEDDSFRVNAIYVFFQLVLLSKSLPALIIIAGEGHFFRVHAIDVRL